MAPTTSTVVEARELFLTGELTDVENLTLRGVRPEIAESWRRSALHGLTPARALPRNSQGADADGRLARGADMVIVGRNAALNDLDAALTLTDNEGRLLRRWVKSARFERRLDARHVVVGASIAEESVGTCSSGIAAEVGRPVMVIGHEHYSEGALTMTTAGAPIRHPVTRKLVGTINYTCDARDTHALMLAWVQRLAMEIEEALLDASTLTQRALLDAYLKSGADARHPVVCLDDHTLITNAAAARMLGTGDQALLWEMAAKRITSPDVSPDAQTLRLESSQTVKVDVQVVEHGAKPVGALLRLTPTSPRRAAIAAPDRTTGLGRLHGRSPAWHDWSAQVRESAANGAPLLLWGEPGTGKTATARAIADDGMNTVVELDAALLGDRWIECLTTALSSDSLSYAILRRLDLLDRSAAVATIRLVENAAVQVIATATSFDAPQDDRELVSTLGAWPGPVLVAPPLRDRIEDLPDLLTAIAVDLYSRSPRWTGEVVQLLGRHSWPANLHSLTNTVRAILERSKGPEVTVAHLPAYLSACTTRRSLTGLENIEAHALVAALRASNGNKREAADKLGIARSTLYRKVRALGLDLTSAAF